jgi:hypothetical protein
MPSPEDRPLKNKPILDGPEPEPEGLGEFVETIVDKDGEVEPGILDEPEEVEEG